jgi:2-iminobutanoate/2-iminopropanoate deaminase/2-aminomuconate deaminase
MIATAKILRAAAALAVIGWAAALSNPAAAQPSQNLEIIHHPNYDKSLFMPFSPAIKIKSGKLLWLAGGTALPVYHDHPHKREQILKYLPNDLEAQVRQTMDGIMETLKAAGGSPKDVVHIFVYRARPRMGDIGRSSLVINSYFAPFNYKPATTNIAVLELGEPEQLVEIQVVAVVD